MVRVFSGLNCFLGNEPKLQECSIDPPTISNYAFVTRAGPKDSWNPQVVLGSDRDLLNVFNYTQLTVHFL